MSILETGYFEFDELASVKQLPAEERYAKGPVAVAECTQEIPCNPCESACKCGAIQIGWPITNVPRIDYDKCTGCGLCVSRCPGLAIFVINKAYGENAATVTFPYEYYPTPSVGDSVKATNRKGEVLCDAKVVKVLQPKSFDHTPTVTIEIPKALADSVRSIKRRRNR